MKNDEEIKTDIYKVIQGSKLQKEVTGIVKKTKRPRNSKKEDIVISILSNENAQLQIATVNVNIYVQDEIVGNQPEEDTKRCDKLCKLAEQLFDMFRGDGYRARLLSQRVYEVEGADEHIINNKIEYKIVNERL